MLYRHGEEGEFSFSIIFQQGHLINTPCNSGLVPLLLGVQACSVYPSGLMNSTNQRLTVNPQHSPGFPIGFGIISIEYFLHGIYALHYNNWLYALCSPRQVDHALFTLCHKATGIQFSIRPSIHPYLGYLPWALLLETHTLGPRNGGVVLTSVPLRYNFNILL